MSDNLPHRKTTRCQKVRKFLHLDFFFRFVFKKLDRSESVHMSPSGPYVFTLCSYKVGPRHTVRLHTLMSRPFMRAGRVLHSGAPPWQPRRQQNELRVKLVQRGSENASSALGQTDMFSRCWTPHARKHGEFIKSWAEWLKQRRQCIKGMRLWFGPYLQAIFCRLLPGRAHQGYSFLRVGCVLTADEPLHG